MITAPSYIEPKALEMNINIRLANYADASDANIILDQLNAYAQDPMGGGSPLKEEVRENLISSLHKIPGAFSLIAFVDNEPAGFANCFQGFSTFKCKPLINIHDFAVLERFRGMKLSQRLLEKVEDIARERGCCKVTLEVLAGNTAAKKAYLNFGFSDYELDPASGSALFWEKPL
ncbi:GNAT family N-acetyltransferase [Reinekea marina]|nr:GNAT family N-acetyltransferase [Reinekea marina]MDN3650631.1 GNAT family N-acetyltransferase [Reinekea marina]